MKLFGLWRRNSVVAVDVVHKRPGYSENVVFVRTYRAKPDSTLDFEKIFSEAFMIAHPNWPIVKIKVKNEG